VEKKEGECGFFMENKRGLLLLSRSRQPNVQWC